jgi:hypothetical protein
MRCVIKKKLSYTALINNIVEMYNKISIRYIDERQDGFQKKTMQTVEAHKERNEAQYEHKRRTIKYNHIKLKSCKRALNIKKRRRRGYAK